MKFINKKLIFIFVLFGVLCSAKSVYAGTPVMYINTTKKVVGAVIMLLKRDERTERFASRLESLFGIYDVKPVKPNLGISALYYPRRLS